MHACLQHACARAQAFDPLPGCPRAILAIACYFPHADAGNGIIGPFLINADAFVYPAAIRNSNQSFFYEIK